MAAAAKGKSEALAVRSSADLASVAELEQVLLGEKDPPDVAEDPSEIQRDILRTILSATSDEEVFSTGQAVGWRELMGVPIELRGFSWRPSDYDEGQPIYFVVRGFNLAEDPPKPIVLTTGSASVMAQLANLAKRQELAGKVVKLGQASETRQGFKPLYLELVS